MCKSIVNNIYQFVYNKFTKGLQHVVFFNNINYTTLLDIVLYYCFRKLGETGQKSYKT